MSCYHPLLGVPDERNADGKLVYKIQGAYDPTAKERIDPRCLRIPCGHCLGCRLDYSRQWADRMMLELEHTGKAVFLTLTYNNENVPIACDDLGQPVGLTLSKRDCQLFMKRLRKEFKDKELRFYACGEYGSNTRRPHMHLIVFGIDLDDFPDREVKGMNELGQSHFISKKLEKIWNKGFTLLADMSWKTCAYVSRYVMKKAFNDLVEWYQEPEFSLMSRRPGIGAYYFDEHKDMFEYSSIYLSSKDGSVKVGIPKYFLKKLEQSDPDKYAELMEARKDFANDRELLMMQKTELSFAEELEIQEEKVYNKTKVLSKLRI